MAQREERDEKPTTRARRVARFAGRVAWGTVKVAGRVLWWAGKTGYRAGKRAGEKRRERRNAQIGRPPRG